MTALELAALFTVAALTLLTVGLITGGRKIRDARAMLDQPRSPEPLYDRTADELGFRPETPWTAGDETDVIEALRLIADGIDPIEPERAARIRSNVVALASSERRQREAYVATVSAPLVFMDTETTGLSLDDDIWEFAAIRRDADGVQTEFHCFIEHDRDKCRRLPDSFREDHETRYLDHRAVTPKAACSVIADAFRGDVKAHVVGAVPQFDTERIARMVSREWPHWPELGWHYHLIDVENLAVGYLNGTKKLGRIAERTAPPWDSNWLSAAVGVDPEQFERHTAMGDVRWAMAIYDAVMGGAS